MKEKEPWGAEGPLQPQPWGAPGPVLGGSWPWPGLGCSALCSQQGPLGSSP